MNVVMDRASRTVTETVAGEVEVAVSASEADAMVAYYSADNGHNGRYWVRRRWDGATYTVAIGADGDPLSFLSYMVGVWDI